MSRTKRGMAFAVCAGVIGWSNVAFGDLDPFVADEQAMSAKQDERYTFCKSPHKPLSIRSHGLCPLAQSTPNCEGFQEACDGPAVAKSKPPTWLAGLLGILEQAVIVVGWTLIGLVLIALVFVIVRAILKRRSEDSSTPEPVDEEPQEAALVSTANPVVAGSPENLLSSAELAWKAGDLERAVDLYLAASLRALDGRGAIRIAKHTTRGEYVRSCGEAEARAPLREIVVEVDRVQFGGERVTPEAVDRIAARATRLVRFVAVVSTLLLFTGCGGKPTSFAPNIDDPSGDALFFELMKRQGANLRPLSSSISSLAAPKAGEPSAIVVVDTAVTNLDEDSWSHLGQWVKEGGTLVLAGADSDAPDSFDFAHRHASTTEIAATVGFTTADGAKDEDEADEEDGEDDTARAVTPEHPRDEDAEQEKAPSPGREHDASVSRFLGRVATPLAFQAPGDAEPVAEFTDGKTYAALAPLGQGHVLRLATSDLLTNVGLVHPGNAAVLVALLERAERIEKLRRDEAHQTEPVIFEIARPYDGTTPPENPLGALVRAGFGLALIHAAFALAALFLAKGVRASRPVPSTPPSRRAFAEHVEATGALYAHASLASHALLSYARWADGRLRQRMPRGTSDPAQFLALCTGRPFEHCREIWHRATQVDVQTPRGDELSILTELTRLMSRID